MPRIIKHGYVELNDTYRRLSMNGTSIHDASFQNYYSPKDKERIDEILLGNKINNFECVFTKAFNSAFGSNNYVADQFFSCNVIGSEGEVYKTEIHYTRMRNNANPYVRCTCPAFLKNDHEPCKHLSALLIYIQKNYKFDKNNYTVIEPDRDESKPNKEVDYKGLEKYFSQKESLYFRFYEKFCRYLEYGLFSLGEYHTKWSDRKIREKFKKLNIDYDDYLATFLARHRREKLSFSRSGSYYDLHAMAKALNSDNPYHYDIDFSNYDTFEKRLKNIELSHLDDPTPYDDVNDLFRAIDTYAHTTFFKVDNVTFNAKFIDVPTFYQLFLVKVDDVPERFYNEFKLGSKSLKDAVIITANNTRYYFLFDKVLKRPASKEEVKVFNQTHRATSSTSKTSPSSKVVTPIKENKTLAKLSTIFTIIAAGVTLISFALSYVPTGYTNDRKTEIASAGKMAGGGMVFFALFAVICLLIGLFMKDKKYRISFRLGAVTSAIVFFIMKLIGGMKVYHDSIMIEVVASFGSMITFAAVALNVLALIFTILIYKKKK